MEQTTPPVTTGPAAKTSWVALAGLLAVLLVVGVGAYYLSGTMPGTETDASQVEAIETQSTSTEPAAIEEDLAAQSPEEFEADFDAAFAELDASLAE